ncbi:hypothetical protein F4604DRAFT_2001389 [Suillus subluteus]|nr:hypothetical protein F4604DRAFT_2001389 [Suillus subluteus]
MGSYIWASITLTSYGTRIRRRMNERDMVSRGIYTDCLLNYETVKYFGGEEYEAQRYTEAIGNYQSLEKRVVHCFLFSNRTCVSFCSRMPMLITPVVYLNFLNLVQTFIITSGLLVSSLIIASRITRGRSNTSDFVVAYYAQLNLTTYSCPTTIKLPHCTIVPSKSPAADVLPSLVKVEQAKHHPPPPLPLSRPPTWLRAYPNRRSRHPHSNALKPVSRNRRRIQDPVLFNASIVYNITYGQPSATPPDENTIVSSAQAGQTHERIMSFPKGYETKVGKRGVRLSGVRSNGWRLLGLVRTVPFLPVPFLSLSHILTTLLLTTPATTHHHLSLIIEIHFSITCDLRL